MDLGNPIETIVHHLLIEVINFLDHWDRFPMVSVIMHVMHTGHDLW